MTKPVLSVEDINLTDSLAQRLFIEQAKFTTVDSMSTEYQMDHYRLIAKISFLQAMSFMAIRETALDVADKLNKEDLPVV